MKLPRCNSIACLRPNPALNADVPYAGLRLRNGPPVSLVR